MSCPTGTPSAPLMMALMATKTKTEAILSPMPTITPDRRGPSAWAGSGMDDDGRGLDTGGTFEAGRRPGTGGARPYR